MSFEERWEQQEIEDQKDIALFETLFDLVKNSNLLKKDQQKLCDFLTGLYEQHFDA